jgi:cellulose synthase/poly-beta-1,6-N-acetylglucosamine synthase-like glycosyltransferase
MLILSATLTVFCGLVALIWVTRNISISRENRHGTILREDYAGSTGAQPSLTVLVAAKDEQETIDRCVRSMLDQEYPNFEMVVCNDRSTDGTAEIVAGIAAENSKLRLLNIDRLPEGWAGKNHAMHTGIAQTRGEWICMIDADCWQTSRRSLSAAMAYALDTDSDMLSVLPTQEFKGFWENVVQPVCSGVMMIWFHPDKVNSPKHPNAYANGAFMLIRREAYEKIGGHEAVRQCVNEDMHIAARVKQSGLRLRVVRNDGLYATRMYTSLGGMYRGWSRIFYGTFVTFKRIGLTLAAVLMVSMLPYAIAILAAVLMAAGAAQHAWWQACAVAAVAAVVAQLTTIYRFYRLVGASAGLAWTYPLGCAITALCLFNSLGKLRKGAKIVWRNTSYQAQGQGVKSL